MPISTQIYPLGQSKIMEIKMTYLTDQKQKCLAARKKNFNRHSIRDVKCHTIRQYTKNISM